MRPSVTLYGRPGCHLCEDALEIVERVRARIPFELEQRDIEADDGLFTTYLERIPVVAIDGADAFELFLDEAAFEQAIRDRRATTAAGPSVE